MAEKVDPTVLCCKERARASGVKQRHICACRYAGCKGSAVRRRSVRKRQVLSSVPELKAHVPKNSGGFQGLAGRREESAL